MLKKDYPPQTGQYKIKTNSEQSTDAWSAFKKARCQISVGQGYHEGAKLKAMIDWCANRFPKGVKICVNDTLQRFNLMFEGCLTEDDAYSESLLEGEKWVKRNEMLWEDQDHIEPIRWDEWLNDEYESERLKTDFLYSANPIFAQAINKNVMQIWNRRKNAKPDLYIPDNFARFAALSRQYLLEEITVFSIMFDRQEAIDIYPGTTIFAATVFQGQDVANAPAGLGKGHFCRIDFKRNGNYQPEPTMPYAQRDAG